MKKRMLTMLLALMVIVSVIPFAASAASCSHKNGSSDWKEGYPAKAATCTKEGRVAIHYCGKCGAWAILGSDPAAQADIYPDNYAVLEAAKTEPTGQHTYVDGECSCGANENCEHTKHTRTQRAKAATCTEAGAKYDIYKCNDCNVTWCNTPDGRVYNFNKNDVVLPAEHDYGTGVDCVVCGERKPGVRACDHSVSSQDWVMVQAYQEVDCINDGMNPIYKCSICGIYGSLRDSGAVTYGSKEAAEEDLTIAARGKHVYKNGVCTDCGDCKNNHKNTVEIPAREATCTSGPFSAGVKCSVCDKIIIKPEVTGGALLHDYDEGVITTAPKCGVAGVKTYTCQREGCTRTYTEPVEQLYHEYDEGVVTTKAACGKKGVKTFSCIHEGCEISYTEEIPALTHKYDEGTVTKEATCAADGVKIFKCINEGCTVSYEEKIAAGKHNWKNIGYKKDNEATCSKTGLFLLECEDCGTKTTQNAPKVACEFVPMDEVAPKCGVAGSTGGLQCKWCGGVKEAPQAVAALRHDYDEGVVTTAPKCGVAGVKTITCKREGCGSHYTEPVAALKHSYDEGTVTTEAVCGKPGVMTFKCVHEGCTVSYTEEIEKLRHTYNEGVVTTAPKCGVAGEKTFTCTRCGSHYEEPIAALTHEYDSTITTAPTCTKVGEETHVCKHCGLTVKTEVKATGHKITNDMATLIGELEVSPTCQSEGKGKFRCQNEGCKAWSKLSVPAVDHEYVTWPGFAATCTKTGRTDGEYCKYCKTDSVKTQRQVIPVLEHDYNVWIRTTKEATCLEDGSAVFKCFSDCNGYLELPVEKLGHDDKILENWPATCTSNGCTKYECQREGCPEKIRYVDSKATGHAPEKLPAVEATCSITGLTEGEQCATCQATLVAQNVIEKEAHTWTDVAGVNATCTENGYTSHKKCSVCGTVEGKSVIEASHYYNDVRCTVCGEANPEYVAPDHGDHDKDDHNKPGHGGNHGHPDFIDPDDNGDNKPDQGGNNVESEDKDDNKQPSQGGNNGGFGDKDHNHRVCKHEHQTTVTQNKTCTTNGSVISYCTDCDTVITVTPDVATGHNFVMGACSVCHEYDPAVYTNDYNNYYIVGGSTK